MVNKPIADMTDEEFDAIDESELMESFWEDNNG
jgi:hypothetical protein